MLTPDASRIKECPEKGGLEVEVQESKEVDREDVKGEPFHNCHTHRQDSQGGFSTYSATKSYVNEDSKSTGWRGDEPFGHGD